MLPPAKEHQELEEKGRILPETSEKAGRLHTLASRTV